MSTTFDIRWWELKRAVNTVASAAGDDSRPVLSGVRVRMADGELSLAATDSYRLHRVRFFAPMPEVEDFEVLVPADWLQRWANGASGDAIDRHAFVTVAITDTTCTIDSYTESATVNLIQGQFPDVDQFLAGEPPECEPVVAAFNPKYLASILKAADVWGSDEVPVRVLWGLDVHKPVRFQVSASLGVLDLVLMPVRQP